MLGGCLDINSPNSGFLMDNINFIPMFLLNWLNTGLTVMWQNHLIVAKKKGPCTNNGNNDAIVTTL